MKPWSHWAAVLGLLLAFATGAAGRPTPPPAVQVLDHAEAAPSDWNAAAPPASGWTPVKLMDFWTSRWPHHDGVVWYRLRWNQADADTPAGLLLDYVCLADAVYVNGSLLHRDHGLVEPLSRSWTQPQYFLLDKPLLRAGENTLLVRVSGLSVYQPGFGTVEVGDPGVLQQRFAAGRFTRYQMRLFSMAVNLVLGGLFLMLWLFRRHDTTYGWFALSTLLSSAWAWNYVATSPWPFTSTDAFQAWNSVFYFAGLISFLTFLLRYCGRRWPRTEACLWLSLATIVAWTLLSPASAGAWRGVPGVAGVTLSYCSTLLFAVYAVRKGRTEQRVLAACMLLPMFVSIHDVLAFYGLIRTSGYIAALASPLTLIGMGFVLAHRFAAAMRRTEGFNLELRREVDTATAQLRQTLEREHALTLTNARSGERLNLVRDLHDGFGGSLVAAIARLERTPSAEAAAATATLRELRDDLRLVIDTTTQAQDLDLAGLLAALRHRWDQRLELAGIDACWRLDGFDGLQLGPARSLELLRFLQEALTNVLKHSGACRVELCVRHEGAHLHAEVRDDGRGFDPADHRSHGAGLASLRSRAARLGGRLAIQAAPGAGAALLLECPLA